MTRFLLIFCLLLTGCVTSQTITLPVPPKWVDPGFRTLTSAEVRATLSVTQPAAIVDTSDGTFTVVDHEWLVAMVKWSDAFLRATGHTYTAESFDCDKFAKAFTLGVEWVAGDAGVKAQPLVARIYVVQERTFANIVGAANTAHALVGFRSNRGIFVLEPQGGTNGTPVFLRLAPLSEYPNRIVRVKLGG